LASGLIVSYRPTYEFTIYHSPFTIYHSPFTSSGSTPNLCGGSLEWWGGLTLFSAPHQFLTRCAAMFPTEATLCPSVQPSQRLCRQHRVFHPESRMVIRSHRMRRTSRRLRKPGTCRHRHTRSMFACREQSNAFLFHRRTHNQQRAPRTFATSHRFGIAARSSVERFLQNREPHNARINRARARSIQFSSQED